jgi:hypothetical protein
MEYKVNTTMPISFEKVENPPYINDSRWQMYKAWICHDLENYNGSYFDISVLQKMGEKLAGVPVVGYISTNNTNDNDFNGHEERLCIQDGDITIEYLGRAYGCVLENNDWKIEQKQHEDGSMRNYLTCNCIIWNMFNEAVEIFERDGKKSQSMELQEGSIQGKFEKDGYFHFTDATIRALCVLGEGVSPAMSNSVIEKFSKVDFNSQVKDLLSEINNSIKQFSQNNIKIDSYYIEKGKAKVLVDKASEIMSKLGFECLEWIVDGREYQITGIVNKTLNKEASENWGFEIYDKDTITINTNDLDKLDLSSISISSVSLLLSKQDKNKQFSLIPKKLEKSNFNIKSAEEGGMQVGKLEIIAKYNLTVEQLDFSIDELSVEQLEEKLKEFSAKVEKTDITFSATYRQKREALQNALDPKIERDSEGNITYEEYLWVNDFDDQYVYVEKTIWTPDYENKYGRYAYSFDEEKLTATITSEFEEMVLVWLTLEENQKLQEERNTATVEFEKMKGEFEDYKNKYSTPNSEVETLKEFQSTKLAEERTQAETELFAQFDEVLKGDEKYEQIKENSKHFTIEELEKELALLFVKKNASFSFNKKDVTSAVKIKISHKENDEYKPYGDLIKE